MFVLSIVIFALVWTVLPNIWIGLAVWIALIVLSLLRKDRKRGDLLLITIAMIFMLMATLFKVYHYQQKVQFITQNFASHVWISTATVISKHSQDKYYVQDDNDIEYILYSSQNYYPGDRIWINAYYKLAYTGFHNNLWTYIDFELPDFSITPSSFVYSFDYPKWLMMKGVHAILWEQNSIVLSNNNMSWLQKIRSKLMKDVFAVYGQNKIAGLILGMLIGDRSEIPKLDYNSFIQSGLVHIVAVSGGNIVMIVVFLSFILFFLPFYIRNFLILLVVIGYSFLCGLDSSVFRAMLMGGLGMLALFRGRQISIWRTMSIALLVMLMINPFYLAYDVGFILSFFAVLGLVLFDKLRNKGKKQNILTYMVDNYLSPSIGATIGVFPILILFMGQLNLGGLIANIFILPILPFVMIYGFVSVYVFQWLNWGWLIYIEDFLLHYIYKVSEITAKYGIYIIVDGIWFKYFIFLSVVFFLVYMKFLGDKKVEDE